MLKNTHANLLVVQVIFGRPLRDQDVVFFGQVEALVRKQIGQGNALRNIKTLVQEGWLQEHPLDLSRHPSPKGLGRPPSKCYTRTNKGWSEYSKIVETLEVYGIKLQ